MSGYNISSKHRGRTKIGAQAIINASIYSHTISTLNISLKILKRRLYLFATSTINIVSNAVTLVYHIIQTERCTITVSSYKTMSSVSRSAQTASSYIYIANRILQACLKLSNLNVNSSIVICGTACCILARFRLLGSGDQAMDLFDFDSIDNYSMQQCDILEVG